MLTCFVLCMCAYFSWFDWSSSSFFSLNLCGNGVLDWTGFVDTFKIHKINDSQNKSFYNTWIPKIQMSKWMFEWIFHERTFFFKNSIWAMRTGTERMKNMRQSSALNINSCHYLTGSFVWFDLHLWLNIIFSRHSFFDIYFMQVIPFASDALIMKY